MKTLITTVALSLAVSFAGAQELKEKDVPKEVKDGFAAKFPGSKAEEWKKEEGNYEVEFDVNKKEMSALFDASGTYKEKEKEIKIDQLPHAISNYCQKITQDGN